MFRAKGLGYRVRGLELSCGLTLPILRDPVVNQYSIAPQQVHNSPTVTQTINGFSNPVVTRGICKVAASCRL